MKKVFGLGINDADYVVQPTTHGKRVFCLFFLKWRNMLRRCYDSNYLVKYPTYQGCVVCDEWLIFSNFKAWMKKQDWEGKHLDKDFLGDGSIYSSSTCCFVEPWLNTLFNDCAASRGPYPKGVSKHRNRFKAQLQMNGRIKYLGLFDTPEKASRTYQKARQQYVIDKMKDYPNERIKQAVLAKVGVNI